jgi:hypothetical protein
VAQRDSQEEAFYGSDAWRQGPREPVLSRIDTYHTIVVDTSEAAVEALSATLQDKPASVIATPS